MAEEEAVEQKKGGNPMMMVLVILIVVLLLAVGGLGYFLYSKGGFNSQQDQAAGGVQQQSTQETKPDIGETFTANIDSLVLNVTDAKGRAKLMKLSFTMKTIEKNIESILEENKAEIVDAVIKQVSARTSEELLTVGGKAMLKEEMIDEINNILNDSIPNGDDSRKRNAIVDIFFTSFVIK